MRTPLRASVSIRSRPDNPMRCAAPTKKRWASTTPRPASTPSSPNSPRPQQRSNAPPPKRNLSRLLFVDAFGIGDGRGVQGADRLAAPHPEVVGRLQAQRNDERDRIGVPHAL